MRVLVTGATGLIGSSVCDALLARGDEVVGLTRNVEKAKPKNPTVRWYAWDAMTERPDPAALEHVDAVVNLIGEEINQRWTDDAKKKILESRTKSVANLLAGIEALPAAQRPKTFIGASASGYYGDRGANVIDEDSAPGEGFASDVVVKWEQAESDAEKLGMRLVVARTGLVLSKHGGLIKQLLIPFKMGVGGPIGGGEQFMSWISLDDEVGIILWALDNSEVKGPINLTGPTPVTNREFSKALGKALNRPAFLPAPGFAVALLRGKQMADELVLGGVRAVPRRTQELGYKFKHPDLDDALKSALE